MESSGINAENFQCLEMFLAHHSCDPEIMDLKTVLDKKRASVTSQGGLDEIIDIYLKALPVIEKALWSTAVDAGSLSGYQKTFRELEHFISKKGHDPRYSFIVVIPVADRPQHLEQCMNSLLTLCNLFHYGGMQDGCFDKVSVIVADDSGTADNIEKIRKTAGHFTARGLVTEYFGAAEQSKLLQQTPQYRNGTLRRIIGDMPDSAVEGGFSHKGAAITRNITCLRLRQILEERGNDKLLFYFIDSDQQFNVSAPAYSTGKNLYAINYFHHLNEIFTKPEVSVLTGKVVGDPPVSPSVMAGHFMDDIIGFLESMAELTPEQPCSFHSDVAHREDDASYHDMANLFGFSNAGDTFRYHCTLDGAHSHRDCINDFAGRLNAFFYGEHPTRATRFNYTGDLADTTPARTVYTGNYIFRPDALKYFIPFATLELRMAGPVLGRILKSEIQHAFVSANLPMLHDRTIETSGQSEFRPGISAHNSTVSMSGEFERQYYGDVMLFTIERLAADDYPRTSFTDDKIMAAIGGTEKQLRDQYRELHTQILKKLSRLRAVFHDEKSWWNTTDGLDGAISDFERFISNIDHNFGKRPECYRLLDSEESRVERLQQIAEAISSYRDDMAVWQDAMA